ncbi:MAG TPA: hypothetical protein VM598_12890 [Bdellovibrionota bacterium]|jgi:hypothetical protein|nr:hypothetical protein [Bdellovibrionota bacterium]
MSLKLRFACLSLGASVDQQTGNLSVFDLVEEVRAPQVPLQLQSLVISLVLEHKEQQEFTGKVLIHLFTPDGKQAMIGSGELRVPPEQRKMRAVFRFGGFPIAHFGSHRFVLSWVNEAGAKIGEAILDFEVIQVTQVAQGVAPSDKPEFAH